MVQAGSGAHPASHRIRWYIGLLIRMFNIGTRLPFQTYLVSVLVVIR
jgi:hypothetical protein